MSMSSSWTSSMSRSNRTKRIRTSDSLFEDEQKPVEQEYKCYKKFPWSEIEGYLKTVFPNWDQYKHTYERDRYKFYIPFGEELLPAHRKELDKRRDHYLSPNTTPQRVGTSPSNTTNDNQASTTNAANPTAANTPTAAPRCNRRNSQSPTRS